METIRIHVKYYSFLRNMTGIEDEHIHLNEPSVGGLIKLLEKRYCSSTGYKSLGRRSSGDRQEILVIVNGKVVNSEYSLKDNDNVSLLPPMAGG